MIFESHSDYCDNPKALFNRVVNQRLNKEYKIYWFVDNVEDFNHITIENVKFISLNKDNKAKFILNELYKITLFSMTKYYFFSHRNLSRVKPKSNQVFFNLTHGTPLKDSTGRHNSIEKSTYILTTSKYSGSLRVKTYGSGEDKLKVLGFPRNDFFFDNNNSLEKMLDYSTEYKKTLIWMPTFRRHKNKKTNDIGSMDSEYDIPVLNTELDWIEFNDFLKSKKVLVLLKVHPAQDLDFIIKNGYSNLKVINNKEILDLNIELYSLLGATDGLITDYSSVYLDYLITDKPIGFTIDDLDYYKEGLGFLVEDPLKYMPGNHISTLNSFKNFVDDVVKGIDRHKLKRNEMNTKFNKYTDGSSADRILRYLNLI